MKKTEKITLGGGCFWCLEAVYDQLEGILDVVSGYAGGHLANPDYESVCRGTTGHAEVVQVVFDPGVINLTEILEVFYTIHDPTTLNRQGADVGTQYRSAIFYHTDDQKEAADKVTAAFEAEQIWPDPIVTEIAPLEVFYPAETYHQDYFERNPYQGYCRAVIAPKVAKFQRKYASRLKT